MRNSRIAKLEYVDGENHYIIQECGFEPSSNSKAHSKTEAMKAARKEATKPLLLTRK